MNPPRSGADGSREPLLPSECQISHVRDTALPPVSYHLLSSRPSTRFDVETSQDAAPTPSVRLSTVTNLYGTDIVPVLAAAS